MTTFSAGSIQYFTATTAGYYTITADGAQGGDGAKGSSNVGGDGAEVTGQFYLTAGEHLEVVVGGAGGAYNNPGRYAPSEGGGGGGTFLFGQGTGNGTGNGTYSQVLAVAGGGGGAGRYSDGGAGLSDLTASGDGQGGASPYGGGGAGVNSGGQGGYGGNGAANGFASKQAARSGNDGAGGFGGGGISAYGTQAAGGGGGGYSGGRGGTSKQVSYTGYYGNSYTFNEGGYGGGGGTSHLDGSVKSGTASSGSATAFYQANNTTNGGFSIVAAAGGTAVTTPTTVPAGGTLQIGDGTTSGTLSGDVIDNGTLIFDPGPAGGTYAGNVSGSGIVTNIGANTETLSGELDIAGVVAQAGTLVLNGPLSGSGAAPDGGSRFAAEVAVGATLINNGAITATNDYVDGVRLHGGTLDNAGTITGRNYSGVYSDIGGTVNNTGSISSGPYGVLLRGGPDTASLTVTGNGSITATGGRGIEANTGSGDITLGTAGAGALGNVTGSSDGIVANTSGAGTISIVTGADVTGSGGTGISAFASGSGAISVTAGGGIIRAAGDGIDATSNGSGAIVVNQSSGQIGARGAPIGGYGIFAVNNGGGTVGVKAGTIVSSNQGVVAITNDSGDVTVATQGNITTGAALAVNAQVNGGADNSSGSIVVTTAVGTTLSANDVNDQNHFVVNAQHDGSGTGTVQVINAATLTRPNGVAGGIAIRALNGTSGMLDGAQTAVSVANTGTITDNFDTGISAQATGAGAIAVSNAGSIAADGIGILASANGGAVSVTTSGDVSGGSEGIYLEGASATNGVTVGAGATVRGGDVGVIARGTAATTVNNSGTIVGTHYSGAGQDTTTGDFALNNLAGGTVVGNTNGVTDLTGGKLTVSNAGTIVGGNYGASGTSAADTVVNSGTIASGTLNGDGSITVGGTDGIQLLAGGTVTNKAGGLIEGAINGVVVTGTLTLSNTGTITSIGNDAVFATGANSAFLNSGTIASSSTSAVVGSTGVAVTNAAGGTLTGGTNGAYGYAVQLAGDSGTFDNYGTATGTAGGVLANHNLSGGGGVSLRLFAGSTTGAIKLDDTANNVSVYTGAAGAAEVDGTDPVTGAPVVLRATGTYGAAVVGDIGLGNGGSVLNLRGTGDGTAANGKAGAISGVVSGAASVVKLDSGTFVLSGANTYTGGTSLVAGTLQVGDGTSAGSLGTGAVTDNAALVLNRAGTTTFGNAVSGSGSLTVEGTGAAGTLTLSGALTQSGGFTVADASNVTIAAAGSYNGPSALTTNGGTLTVLGTVTTTNDQGIVTQNGGVVTVASGGSVTGYDTGVNASGSAATTVNNSGTIVGTHYSGAGQDTVTADFTLNNFAGGTVVGNTNGVADGTGGKLTVGNAGTIVGGNDGAVGTSAGDAITNSGAIAAGTLNGDGTITVGGTDGIQLRAGGTVTNKAGGLIEGGFHGVESDANTLNLSNAGRITSVGNDAVIATGANAMVLNTGTITASSTSAVVGTTGLAVTNAAGGTLTGGTNGAYGYAVQLAGDSGTFDNYGTATGSAGGVLANHNLSGGGGVSLRLFAGSTTGAIKLDDTANNVSVYTGAAGAAEVDGTDPVTGAPVVLRAAGSYGAAVVGDIALGNGGSVLNLRGTGDGTAANGKAGAISGVVSGAASVVKLDSGTFVLSGANTYTGGTSLVAGTLDLASATAAGTGAVTFANAAPGATLAIEKSALDGNAHFAETVGSFAIGDALDLRGIGLASTASVDANGVLTVGNGADALETVQLANLQSGDAFVLASDGMGGTQVTLTSLSGAGGLQVGGGGTLVLGSGQAGTVAGPVHDGGTLAFDGPGSFTFGADVDGSGRIVVSGIAAGGTATFSGALTQSGGFTVADASNVVLTGSASGAGGTTISGGTLQVGDGATTGLLGGNVVDNGTLAFDPGTANGAFAGNVSGSGIVAKIGAGTETLTGALTQGGLAVQGGTLALGATATLATAGTAGLATGGSGSQNQAAVAVTNGATFSNAGTISAGNQGVLLQNGTFTNTGRISAPNQSGVFAASGAVTVANTGAGAISGANSVDANLTTADAISVTGSGSFTGTNGFGIRGVSQGGNVTLGTPVAALGTVTGAGNGLIAQTNGVGAISIVTGANVTGSGGTGISATASGSGAVSVSANGGTVTGGNGDGIDATTSGTGAVSVTTAANETILSSGNGIAASSTGAGTPKTADGSTATDVSVANAGAIRHTAASGNGSSSGISANTAGVGFLAVANSGAIGTTGPAFANGIVATRSNATADVTVTNSGAIGAAGDAVTGTGILATTQGRGNASVGVSNTAAITSGGTGIDATDTGNGNVRVTGNGAIVAGAIGVRVTETGNGGAFVGTPYNDASALGAITAVGTGIAASTTGGGGITVYSGAVTSSGGSGIVASVTGGTGAIAVTTRGNVSGKVDGISVAGGSASNIVTNAFTVSGAVGLEVNGGTTTLINSGVIASTAAGGNALQVDSGTLVLGDSIGTVTGNIGLQGAGSTLVLSGSGPQTIANAITGVGALSKTGTGTTTLSGASTYTGGTSLVAGTLDLASATAAGTGAITFANVAGAPGATLAIEKSALDGNAHFAETVGSFAIGDTLDLRGIGLASTASVDANGVLTIGNGAGALEIIQLANLQAGDGFVLASDGKGGTQVTLVADAGPTIAAVAPTAVEKGQSTVVGIVTPGVLTDPETLTQTSGAGTLTLGAARADGSRQVLYTAPQGIALSKLDAVTYTVRNQNGTTASGAASVQLDAGATIVSVAPAVVEKGQQTIVGTVKAGLTGDTLTLTKTTGSGTLTLGMVQNDGTQQVLYTAPATVAVSGIDQVAYTVADQHGAAVASGSNSVQLDAGATIITAAPAAVEKGQQTVVGTVMPGIVGDTLTLTQTAGSGVLTLGAVQKDGTQQVLYTAPATVPVSGIDKVAYTVADQHKIVVASASNGVQLDAGATITTVAPAVVEKGQQTVVGTVMPGIVGDTLTLTQTAGSGTLTLGAVQKDSTQQVFYTAPATVAVSGIDKVSYTVADQHADVVASGSNSVQLDAGATIAASVPTKVGHGQTVTIGTVTPGLSGDTLTLAQTKGSGTLSLVAGAIRYTAPNAVTAGQSDGVAYTIRDQHQDATAAASANIVLDPGPTAASTTLTVGHNQVLDVTSLVNGLVKVGLAGDAETITALTAAKGSATIGANGKLTYASAGAGSDTLAYTATDQLGDAASGTVTVTVDGGPTLTGVASTAKLGQSVNLTSTVLAAATPGLKGDVLTITGDTTSGTAGTVSLNNGVLTYTASGAGLSHIPANGSQTDSFVYTVSDQYGDTASATAKVTVTNPATVINGPFFGLSTIQGTTGTDIINASGFFNTIASNGGNDVINAGLGNASVTTGSGDVVTNLQGFFDTVSGGDGWNIVSGSAGNATVTLGNGNDTVNTGGYFNTIKLGNGNDAVVAGQGGACVTLGSGQDSVTLAGYSNSVVAGDGNDVVKGGDGLATVTLGNGNDTVALGGWSNTIKVGSGSNTIVAGSGLATVVAGAGTDVVTLAGTGNSVTLNGSTATVSGGQGNDTVTVNGGTDALTFAGWYDHAVLNGTTAASIMDLGNALRIDIGSSTQTDTITNFGSKDTSGIVDLLNGAGGYGSVSSIMNALHDDGHGGTMLALGTTGSIDFAGTSKNQLHASNFKIG